MRLSLLCCLLIAMTGSRIGSDAGQATEVPTKQLIILDTDIGDDIDDAYALALLLQSPSVKLLGVTTAFGDTNLRARLCTHFLHATGFSEVPVYAGPATQPATAFTQKAYAEAVRDHPYPDAIDFLDGEIHKHPGEITLVAIAPLTNLGALIERDPAGFRLLKRVVMMGGSVYRGYGKPGVPAQPEWNIVNAIPAAQALFAAGVPIFMMPLDATQVPLDTQHRADLDAHPSALTRALHMLTAEWSGAAHHPDPTLFDAVAAGYAVDSGLCPTTPLHILVDDKGFTRLAPGPPNAEVCLKISKQKFLDFYMAQILR